MIDCPTEGFVSWSLSDGNISSISAVFTAMPFVSKTIETSNVEPTRNVPDPGLNETMALPALFPEKGNAEKSEKEKRKKTATDIRRFLKKRFMNAKKTR